MCLHASKITETENKFLDMHKLVRPAVKHLICQKNITEGGEEVSLLVAHPHQPVYK